MKKIIALVSLAALTLQVGLGVKPPAPPAGCTIVSGSLAVGTQVLICGTPGSCGTGGGNAYASYTTQNCDTWCLTGTCGFAFVFNTCTNTQPGPSESCCTAGASPCGFCCGITNCDPPYGP